MPHGVSLFGPLSADSYGNGIIELAASASDGRIYHRRYRDGVWSTSPHSVALDRVPRACPLTYTFVVTNNGPLTATGVRLSYPLPLGTEVSGNFFPSQGTCSLSLTNILTCDFGTLASGNSATLPLPIFSLSLGLMTSTATVTANENDFDPSNNMDTETTTVTP